MDILPFEVVLVLRLALVGIMPECHYAKHAVVGGNVEDATDDLPRAFQPRRFCRAAP